MPMRFPYLKAARVKLQERRNACLKAHYRSASQYAASFINFISDDPVVRSITTELKQIAETKYSDPDALVNGEQQCLNLPADELDRAAFHLRLLQVYCEQEIPHMWRLFGHGSNRFQDIAEDFFSQVLTPLCSYIDERIDEGDLLLYTLTRYQRECAWFETPALLDLRGRVASGKLEEAMDRHLRAWLFREGVDYPFSTPSSPSGRADVVIWQGEEPLAIEVKVYDGDGRGTKHVAQGLWQAQRYAQDYGVPFGYLVVFNVSTHLISFDANRASDGPPCVVVGNSNVFAIVLDVGVHQMSASKEKPLETKIVELPAT